MTVHDLVIANASGSAVRTDLNSALAAIGSNSSNSSAVTGSNSYPYQWQVRTDVNKLYMRDGSTNTTWHEVGDVGVANLGLAKLASPTFTGVVEIANGTNGAPSIAFDSDTDTGIYRSASNVFGISASGTASHLFKSDGSEPQVPLKATNGSASAPSISFASDTNLGLYRSNTDHLSIATSGAERAYFNDNGLNIRTGLSLRLFDSDHSHYVGIKANSNTAANYDLILPNNSGSSNQILKSDGSGNLVWTTVASLQDSGKVKGVIAFNGADASVHHSSNLTVSRTGTGTYRVTINSSVRNGTNYGVVIGNIDESHAHGVGDLTTNSSNSGNADHFRVAFVSGRTGSYFDIRAYKFDSEVFTVSTDDHDRAITYRRVAADPSYVCLTFFS
tara:strand:+ start:943 stop:2109 length:1167 start_codon:yes stop_codon:yes gene_type:complete